LERQTLIRRAAIPAGLFLSALAIRLIGIDFGLPHMYHWDEHFLAAPIKRFLAEGELLPHMYIYPTGYIYIQFIFAPISYLIFVLNGGPASPGAMGLSNYLLVGRVVTACIGAASVPLIYYFAVRVWRDALAGVLAAILLLLSPLHAMDSRYLTTDIAMATAAFLGFFLLSIYLERRDRKTLMITALTLGVAFAFKYNAAFFVAAAAGVVAVSDRTWRRPLALAAVAFITFLLITPGIIFDTGAFLRDTVLVSTHYFKTGDVGRQLTFIYMPYLMQLWLYTATPVPLICAVGGVLVLFLKERRRALAFLVFPASYLVFLGLIRVYFNRGFEPALPYLCLLAGLAAAAFVRLIRRKFKPFVAGIATAAFVVVLFARPAVVTAREAYWLARGDRRTEAKEWFEANVPWPTRAAKEAINWGPQAEGGQVETPPVDPNRYDVGAREYLVDRPAEKFARAGVVYLMTPDLKANRDKFAAAFPSRAEEGRRNYDSIMANSELVLHLPRPRRDFRPAVEIYRLKDDILRTHNLQTRGVSFRPRWVRSEADPTQTMAKAGGRYVLKAPSRAGAYFTAPAEDFTLAICVEPLAGRPTVVVEVDGTAVAAREIRGEEVVKTLPLSAPPYFRHLAVRCLGPEGASFKLKYVIVEKAQ
jgi:hypothetical protein